MLTYHCSLLDLYTSPYSLLVLFRNQIGILYVKPGSDQEQRQKVLNSWYRQQLKLQIPPLIDKWEKVINVNINEWGVKLMRTKWGTCNIQDQRILLNLELAKKDPLCLEYVIVHEITHLLERTHGAKFQALMDEFMPNWRTYKEKLNRYQLNSD